uniref:G_PROTEIN_RECEP_F1_2 domain-containing protein n=1 Tax=Bursaphelenchus xylophilus TaxID=6326 RepID=A0A1I7SCM4_BURXY
MSACSVCPLLMTCSVEAGMILHRNRVNARRVILLSFYGLSILLSILLFFFAGIYCRLGHCTITWTEQNRQYAQIFPMFVACLTLLLSLSWLISNSCYMDSPCMQDYNCLEMPTAVFCSLMAGICAVIEIHYSFDYSYIYWSEKWTFAAADAVAMVFLHAAIAFALT